MDSIMDNIDQIVAYGMFGIILIILLLNIFQVLKNMFTRGKREEEQSINLIRSEIREEVNEKVKPHLTSLEGMYEKSDNDASTFSTFVYGLVKEKFSTHLEKNEKLLEDEICHCCNEYGDADCKESFCLEGSGINCPKA